MNIFLIEIRVNLKYYNIWGLFIKTSNNYVSRLLIVLGAKYNNQNMHFIFSLSFGKQYYFIGFLGLADS